MEIGFIPALPMGALDDNRTSMDQYQYQRTRTNDNLALQQFAAVLKGADFEIWELKAAAAVCGAVSMRHPERDTWFLEVTEDT